jgi:Ran GTPase-activating protein (RanGAP) involved in mRNA processing and transport
MDQDDPERETLARRAKDLWAEHKDSWIGEMPKGSGVKWRAMFRRGWPESAECTAAAFLKRGAKIFEQLPLTELAFDKLTAASCVKVAASPLLARVKTLRLYNQKIGDKGAVALLRSPHLSGLTALCLTSTGITAATMQALAEAPFRRRLEVLELSDNVIYDSGIDDLADAEGWESLREFKGHSMGLSHLAAAAFADAPIFSRLETLEVAQNWLRDAGVARLVQGHSATWRILDLGQNEISDVGAEALARSPRVARLEQLVLRDNAIGARGVRALADSPHLARLRELELHGNLFGNEGALAESPYLRNLTSLDVDGAGFGPESMEALARSPTLAGLRTLYVGNNPIGPRGAQAIAESPHLRHLQTLVLWDCRIGDEGCIALMQSPNLDNVTWLHLDNNDLTDAGARAILDSTHLANLTDELGLDDDGVSDEMVRQLRKRFKRVLWFYRPNLPEEEG